MVVVDKQIQKSICLKLLVGKKDISYY